MAHPDCNTEHICAVPSGRQCIEDRCTKAAGTWWGPNWCPEHDKRRLESISASFGAIQSELASREASS